MGEPPRFTLEMVLHDRHGESLQIAVDLDADAEMRINTRMISEYKFGLGDFEEAVKLLRRKEYRRDLFKEIATRLGHQLADRMEDAEGWHDMSRIEPARKLLGGKW